MEIKVLLIGDIVGKPGRSAVKELLGDYVASNGIEFVIANGENAAQGSGITAVSYTHLTLPTKA